MVGSISLVGQPTCLEVLGIIGCVLFVFLLGVIAEGL